MVTTTDMAVFQQQLRQEVTDVIQQLRTEMNEKINSRMDMLNSISTAMQSMSVRPSDFKPYKISDLIPRSWEGKNEKKRIPKLHVRLALVDASMVRSWRASLD